MDRKFPPSDVTARLHADRMEQRRVKCLLVDDREDNLVSLEALLAGEQLQLFKARSGAEALELLLEHEFALALIDVHMPEMNGFELAEYMRGSERTRSIPIIFVTAGSGDMNRVFKGYEAGAVDFLSKPLSSHVVKSKIRIFIELYLQRQRLREQLAELQLSQQQTERALSVRNHFISMAGHELRTPLAVLRLQLQLGQRQLPADSDVVPAEKVKKLLGQLDRQIDRLLPLVDEMLDVSRIQGGKLRIHPEHCNLSTLTEETVERLRPLLSEAGCAVSAAIEPEIWGCWDQFRLEQALANLLTNAARYGRGKPVQVRVHRHGSDEVDLEVADQGVGIPSEYQERIFLPFERVDGGDVSGGLGLGLHIVRTIVEMHGGGITVDSAPNTGATFQIRLPLAPPPAEADTVRVSA